MMLFYWAKTVNTTRKNRIYVRS